MRIDYGWYAHILHDCTPIDLNIDMITDIQFSKATRRAVDQSWQSAYFVE